MTRSTEAKASDEAALARMTWPWPQTVTSQTSLAEMRGFFSSEKWISACSHPSRCRLSRETFSSAVARETVGYLDVASSNRHVHCRSFV